MIWTGQQAPRLEPSLRSVYVGLVSVLLPYFLYPYSLLLVAEYILADFLSPGHP